MKTWYELKDRVKSLCDPIAFYYHKNQIEGGAAS